MGSGPVMNFWRDRAAKSFSPDRDWTQQELAQFYRVEWALGQAGISVECDRGVSDEGDPWFAFCRASDSEVVIHIAREGSTYILAGFLSDRVQRGRDFGDLVERLLAEHPAKTIDKRGQSNVIMHPATMLALLVSIAFLHSNEGKAAAAAAHDQPEASVSPAAIVQSQAGAASVPRAAGNGPLVNAGAPLAANLELGQAMTILRVASLLSQVPVDQAFKTESAREAGFVINDTRLSATNQSPLTQNAIADRPGLDSADAPAVHTSQASLSAANHSVEKLLEVVAKLWTFPDLAQITPSGFGVAAAVAFFTGVPATPDIGSGALAAPHHTRHSAEPSTDASASAKVAESPVEPSVQIAESPAAAPAKAAESSAAAPAKAVENSTAPAALVTIVHTPSSSETAAQTILKITVPDQKSEIVLKGTDLSSSTKIYSVVNDIVAHAKSLLPESGAAVLGNGRGDLDVKAVGKSSAADNLAKTLPLPSSDAADKSATTDKATSVAEKADPSYTTVIGDGMVKHTVLDSKAEAVIERAIMAFKEDAGKYAVTVTGKDVIFYNADAVINHSTEVVVELWQFKDGSSISLVGLSVDGHLPYSL